MRSLAPVTAAELPQLACPYCGSTVSASQKWVEDATRLWGLCGWRLVADGQTEALLLLAPSAEPGAALVVQLWVVPERCGRGLGKRLIHGAAAALKRTGTSTILSRGSRAHPSCTHPPKDFLRAVGFTRQLDERYYRLDLNRAVSARNPLQSLLNRVAEALQPGPGEPAPGGLSPRALRRSA